MEALGLKDDLSLNGLGVNSKDPLLRSGPERQLVLTHRFGQAAHQFSVADVINASGAMVVTAMRQTYKNRQDAEKNFDEIFGRLKSILLSHYDGAGNRADGIFPFDQTIHMPLVDARSKV